MYRYSSQVPFHVGILEPEQSFISATRRPSTDRLPARAWRMYTFWCRSKKTLNKPHINGVLVKRNPRKTNACFARKSKEVTHLRVVQVVYSAGGAARKANHQLSGV